MAVATFVQQGQAIDHTPSAALSAGDVVVIGDMVGVTPSAIAASALGALTIAGVFDVAKDSSAGPVFRVGQDVYFDTVLNQAVHKSAPTVDSIFLGRCVKAAATGDSTVRVALNQRDVVPSMADKVWEAVDISGGSKTLDIEDVGKVLDVTGHLTNVVTLPAVAAGLEYVIRAAGDGVQINVSPAAVDKIMGPDIGGTDGKDRILTAATAREGDYIHLAYGGATGWMILAMRGIWAEEP